MVSGVKQEKKGNFHPMSESFIYISSLFFSCLNINLYNKLKKHAKAGRYIFLLRVTISRTARSCLVIECRTL